MDQKRVIVLLIMLSTGFILSGMALKTTFEYAPAFGWLFGILIMFLTTFFVAGKIK
ncbi:hypothetical protein [Bacillus sp. T33-2]|uniref:hypothetical protein n=1 Tax=Bacillus sp. T33-2 TaxID=2054168 RepID=UPI0015E157E7|nr:hypothetical protein [Bacillus sp. T33-2]